MSAQTELNPTPLTRDELKVLAFALAGELKDFFVQEKPMTTKQAIVFLGRGRRSFYDLVNKGIIKGHRVDGGNAFYFPSEIIHAIKKL